MKCCKGRWENWAQANWANSLLHCVFDTNNAFLTLVPARQSAMRDFFALPTFRPMANKKTAENFVVSFFLSIFALQ